MLGMFVFAFVCLVFSSVALASDVDSFGKADQSSSSVHEFCSHFAKCKELTQKRLFEDGQFSIEKLMLAESQMKAWCSPSVVFFSKYYQKMCANLEISRTEVLPDSHQQSESTGSKSLHNDKIQSDEYDDEDDKSPDMLLFSGFHDADKELSMNKPALMKIAQGVKQYEMKDGFKQFEMKYGLLKKYEMKDDLEKYETKDGLPKKYEMKQLDMKNDGTELFKRLFKSGKPKELSKELFHDINSKQIKSSHNKHTNKPVLTKKQFEMKDGAKQQEMNNDEIEIFKQMFKSGKPKQSLPVYSKIQPIFGSNKRHDGSSGLSAGVQLLKQLFKSGESMKLQPDGKTQPTAGGDEPLDGFWGLETDQSNEKTENDDGVELVIMRVISGDDVDKMMEQETEMMEKDTEKMEKDTEKMAKQPEIDFSDPEGIIIDVECNPEGVDEYKDKEMDDYKSEEMEDKREEMSENEYVMELRESIEEWKKILEDEMEKKRMESDSQKRSPWFMDIFKRTDMEGEDMEGAGDGPLMSEADRYEDMGRQSGKDDESAGNIGIEVEGNNDGSVSKITIVLESE